MADDAAISNQSWGDFGREAALRSLVRGWVDEAQRRGASQGTFADWTVTVSVVAEAGDPVGELVVAIAPSGLDDSLDPAVVALAKQIMGFFVGVPPTSWLIAPRRAELCIHVQVEVASATALLGTNGGGQSPSPGDVTGGGEDRPAHIVRESELVHSLVDGHVVRSMCGHTFVPTETGEKARSRSVCARCALVVALARRVVENS